MFNYSNYHQAIIDLHDRGFSEDFVLFGNDLLWIQEKTFVSDEDFSIQECYHFDFPEKNIDDLVIFGIITVCRNIKGILMNHYTYSSAIPAVIIHKLKKMGFY
jgi:hypothetical protein